MFSSFRTYNRFISTASDNALTYLFKKAPRRGPYYVNFGISQKCNLHCLYCGQWQDKPQENEDLLTTKHKLAIIDQLAACGVCFLSLYNREPLLAPDLEDIIMRAKKHGLFVNLSTNGLLLEESARMLVLTGVDSIIVSVESFNPSVHDGLRGHQGLLRKIESGIKILHELRINRKRPKINIRLLINHQTYRQLPEYVRYWKNKVDGIIMKPINENSEINYSIPEKLRFPANEKEQFQDFFSAFLKNNRALNNVYTRQIPKYIFNPEKIQKKYNCFAGLFFGSVDINGDVYFCAEHKHKVGNLRNDNFITVWRSAQAMDERKKMGLRRNCSCWLELFLFNIYLTRVLGKRR